MRLLITTQKVDKNDPILGFFHHWIAEFSKHFEEILVVCLQEGEHALPRNVRVYSLGKEKKKVSRFVYAWRFLKLAWQLRNDYDTVFVHMNPEYAILGGLFWKFSRKKVGLWYLHKAVNMRLRLAVLFADVVFSASKESFRLGTPKLRIMGHGIDLEMFNASRIPSETLRIVTVGRVSKTKRVQEMLAVCGLLSGKGIPFAFTIIGAPVTKEDHIYEAGLKEEIAGLQYRSSVHFLGAVTYDKLPSILSEQDIFLNMSATGSLDKAVLEAMAAGVLPVVSNEAFQEILEPHGLFVQKRTPEAFAGIISTFQNLEGRAVLGRKMRDIIAKGYSLQGLISKIRNTYNDL